MTIQERIDSGQIRQRFREGWKEGSIEEISEDYPFLENYIKRINWWHKNNRVAIFKSTTEEKRYQLYMFTPLHQYSIWVTPKSMGAGSSCRYFEPLEDWARGHDLPDGKCCEETFISILFAILHDELIRYDNGGEPTIVTESEKKNG